MKRSVQLFWLFFLGLPFIEIIVRLLHSPQIASLEWSKVLYHTVLSVAQAGLSTLGILVLGLFVCLGLFQANGNWAIRLFLAVPAFVPSVFILTSVLAWGLQFGFLIPPGIATIIFLHILINFGFAAVLLNELFRSRMGLQWELAFIEGASRMHLLKEVLVALKFEITVIASGFFAFCFTSFSLPLVLGGQSGKTLEVLAFEQLAIRSDFKGAVILGILQMLIFSGMYMLVRRESIFARFQSRFASASHAFSYYNLPHVAVVAAGFLFVIVFVGMFIDIPTGWHQLVNHPAAIRKLFEVTAATLLLSAAAGVSGVALILLVLGFLDLQWVRQTLLLFGAVSVALLGVGLFLMELPVLIKLLYGLTLLYVPAAYRFRGVQLSEELLQQFQVARTLGASRWTIFSRILLPQSLPAGFRLGGIVAVWAAGDFAFSSVVTGEVNTLALFLKSTLGSYRIELASILCVSLLIISAMVFLLFEGCSYVSHQKLRN